ncbi:MAG: methyltransferase domain-containing protein, partial [Saprospiraceae bacterium]
MGEWFKTWFDTTYYDILYDDRDELEAEEFIQHLLRYLNLDQRAFVLDIGCGTGRHALALAEYGFDVTGIDLSLNRIEKALVY